MTLIQLLFYLVCQVIFSSVSFVLSGPVADAGHTICYQCNALLLNCTTECAVSPENLSSEAFMENNCVSMLCNTKEIVQLDSQFLQESDHDFIEWHCLLTIPFCPCGLDFMSPILLGDGHSFECVVRM